MTRQEYDRKTADGTLTVRDVLENREYATAEQLAAVNASGLRLDRGPADLMEQAARLARTVEHLETVAALDAWEHLNGEQEPTPAEG